MPITPDLATHVEYAVEQAVRHYVRRGAPAPAEDMRQEGWQIALRGLQSYNPKMGDVRGYLYVAVRRSLGTKISQWLAVPAIHGHVECARTMQTRVELHDHAIKVSEEHEVPVPALVEKRTPEDDVLHRESVERRASWRIKFRRSLMRCLSDWDAHDVGVVERIYGFDGAGGATPATVAKELEIEARDVYRVIDRLKRRLVDDIPLYGLGRRLQEIGT